MSGFPVVWLDRFKAAAYEVAKPFTTGEAGRAVPRPMQRYSKPQPAVAETRTDTAQPKQAIQPPPVQ